MNVLPSSFSVLVGYTHKLQGALKRSQQVTKAVLATSQIQEKIDAINSYCLPKQRADLVRQLYGNNLPEAVEIEGRTATEIRVDASKYLSSDEQRQLAYAVDRAIYSISSSAIKRMYPDLAQQLNITAMARLRVDLTLDHVYKSARDWAELILEDLVENNQDTCSISELERVIALTLNRPPTRVVSDDGLVERYSFYTQNWEPHPSSKYIR